MWPCALEMHAGKPRGIIFKCFKKKKVNVAKMLIIVDWGGGYATVYGIVFSTFSMSEIFQTMNLEKTFWLVNSILCLFLLIIFQVNRDFKNKHAGFFTVSFQCSFKVQKFIWITWRNIISFMNWARKNNFKIQIFKRCLKVSIQ